MSTLLLEFWTEENDFYIYAEAEDYEKELTLEGQAKEIINYFNTIYNILEEKKTDQVKALENSIRWLSDRLITPFANQIKQSNLVRFVVYEDLIRCAFDLLLLEDKYLFLQHSICYQVEEGESEDAPVIEMGSALLIADLTADPEEACLAVSQLISESEYAQVEDASLRMIQEAADQVDVLVVSAHGDLEADNSGAVYINEDSISANLIGKLEAWLVYFDSCSQGSNMEYLQAFQEESDVQFYLAPIVSNDAGDSSTKTMTWFFKALKEHLEPIRALSETRKRLFEYYRQQKQLDLVTSLNKAFVFRMYEFVDGEE